MFARKAGFITRLCELARDPTSKKLNETTTLLYQGRTDGPASGRNPSTDNDNNDDRAVQFFKKILKLFLCGCIAEPEEELFLHNVKRILGQLSCNQLNALLLSVSTSGRDSDCCVALDLNKFRRKYGRRRPSSSLSPSTVPGTCAEWMLKSPHLMLCLAFRYSNELSRNSNFTLQSLEDCLMPLQCCNVGADSNSVCINPYHWTLVDQFHGPYEERLYPELISSKSVPCDPASFSPSYDYDWQDEMLIESIFTPRASQRHRNRFPDFTNFSNQTSIDNIDNDSSANKWSVLYAENRECQPYTCTLDRNNRLEICSKSTSKRQEGVQQILLRSKRSTPPSNSLGERIRDKIGFGIILISDANRDIWLYNRSQIPVFVRSLSANIQPTDSATKLDFDSLKDPFKIMPGHMSRVFSARSYERIHQEVLALPSNIRENISTSIENHFVKNYGTFHISFGKGFGRAYSARDIIDCPCWIEFSRFSDHQQWGD